MLGRIRRGTVYAATAAAMISVVAGFALAALSVTPHSQGAQADQIATGSIAGLSYSSVALQPVSSNAPAAPTGSAGSPSTLASGENDFCMSATPCATGDPSETVTYAFSQSLSGSVQLTLYVGAGSAGGQSVLYVTQAAPPGVSGTIVMVWDLGSSGATVSSVTITAQACTGTGGACP